MAVHRGLGRRLRGHVREDAGRWKFDRRRPVRRRSSGRIASRTGRCASSRTSGALAVVEPAAAVVTGAGGRADRRPENTVGVADVPEADERAAVERGPYFGGRVPRPHEKPARRGRPRGQLVGDAVRLRDAFVREPEARRREPVEPSYDATRRSSRRRPRRRMGSAGAGATMTSSTTMPCAATAARTSARAAALAPTMTTT